MSKRHASVRPQTKRSRRALLYGDETTEAELSQEERGAIFDAHMRFHDALRDRGALVQSAPLAGCEGAFTVRRDTNRRRLVLDGPFTETKEVLGSFYVVECADRAEAQAIAEEVPASPGLVVEVWSIAEM